jgi:PAS domain S-box-containing protein
VEAYIVDDAGRGLAASTASSPAAIRTDLSATPPVAALLAGPATAGSLRYPSGSSDRLSGYARVPELGWGVVVELPIDAVLGSVRAGRDLAFGLLLFSIALAAGLGSLVAGRFAAPLGTLARAVDRLAAGDTQAPTPRSRITEIGNLAAAFGTMRDRLVARTAEREQAAAALRRAEETQRFLAEASQVLATSLDYETTLTSVARLVIPMLADFCIVDLIEGSTVRHVAVAHADPAREEALRELRRRYQPSLTWENHPVALALRTGQPQLFPEAGSALLDAAARDDEHLQMMQALAFASYMVVPLRARGRTLGTISLALTQTDRRYGPADLTLAQELARRAALAIDTARLYPETQAAEARYRGLFNGLGEAIVVADASGRFIEVNAAAATLFGYTQDELLQMGVGALGAEPEETSRERFALLQREGFWHGEVAIRRKDGTEVPAESWQSVIHLPATTVYVAAWLDISERRALERLQQEFLAIVTHELKTPLASIKGLAQLMQRRGAYSDRSLGMVVAQADRLARLIDDLLDVSRLEAGRLALRRVSLDLVELARTTTDQAQATTHTHQLRVVTNAHPVTGHWDRDRLAQVMQNLLTNAIKYSSGGEIVTQVTAVDHEARVSVTDHGTGIAPEALDRLFSRFYRTEAASDSTTQGMGLGLYISKGLIEAHGGRLWVESALGQGSTFTFTLPLSRARRRSDASISSS